MAQLSDSGRLNTIPPLSSSYNFVFEACARKDAMLFPEVMVRSDTEIKLFNLSEVLESRVCQTSSIVIKAADPNSIQGTIITAGDNSRSIGELEAKVESLKDSIAMTKKALTDLTKQTPQPDDLTKGHRTD